MKLLSGGSTSRIERVASSRIPLIYSSSPHTFYPSESGRFGAHFMSIMSERPRSGIDPSPKFKVELRVTGACTTTYQYIVAAASGFFSEADTDAVHNVTNYNNMSLLLCSLPVA